MDMKTKYLGFELPHPFMPGSSPMADDLDTVKQLEDAGAAAIVMRSLFEEQIVGEEMATHDAMEGHANSFAESLSFFPSPDEFTLGSNDYLEQIRKVKATVGIPVIASLNGINEGNWVRYATQIKEEGWSPWRPKDRERQHQGGSSCPLPW